MSYFIAGAIVVSAVAGAASSNKASKDQAKGVKKGLDQSAQLAADARADAKDLFERSSLSQRGGVEAAFDFYKKAAQRRINPYIQGNMAAQGVIGQGAQQANNAILGLPVDMSFTQPQAIQYDQSYLADAKLPEPTPKPEPEPDVIGAAPAAKKPSMKDEYKPSNQLKKKQDKKLKKLKSLF